ncbi:hypothetical protein ACFOTA_22495 [Chitinophaga sp. GCM10012297]|uniref:Aspartyl protease n=1 Tax=Chitinophaga chungangae TaxID=2821488 RepID=A0ABS3YJY9_9BACT|nr:hypothetical protein [Chitinophaga chungangae]MBO9155000.1 hypothetical protein [Chitinophaga chungangae]
MHKLFLLIFFTIPLRPSAQTVTVPFATDASGRIFFYATVGPDTVSMLFNTYATHNRLSPDFAASPLLKKSRSIKTTDNTGTTTSKNLYAGPLAIGGLSFDDALFSLLPPEWKIVRAGSLGIASLSKYCWKIDMSVAELWLSPNPFPENGTPAFKMAFKEGDYPHARCALMGDTYSFALDWGSTDGFLVREDTELGQKILAAYKPVPKTVTIQGVNRFASEDTMYEVKVPEIRIGEFVMKNQLVVVRKKAPSNLIGMQVLRQFNAIFNFHDHMLDLVLFRAK